MANNENLKPLDSKRASEVGKLGGRPKGTKSVTTIVKALLDKKVELRGDSPIGKAGDKRKWSEVIAARMIVEASKGNMKAMRELLDRTEGKISQPIEGPGEDGDMKFVVEFR